MEARFLDGANPVHRWDPAAVARNARRAAQDSSAAAYIGELDSQPTRTSLPITNDAGIAQISPGASAIDLTAPAEGYPDSPEVYRPSGEVTFARVIPSDAVQVRALAAWAGEMRVREILVRPGVTAFQRLMSSRFAADAAEIGVDPRDAAATGSGEASAPSFAGAGGTGPGMLAVDGRRYAVSGAIEPDRLPGGSFAVDFRAAFDRRPGPYAAYGYEAMRVALDAIGGADTQDGFRGSVVDGVLGSEHEGSVLGDFSITDEGDTTLCSVQRYRRERRLVPLDAVCAAD